MSGREGYGCALTGAPASAPGSPISLSAEVMEALHERVGLVALESVAFAAGIGLDGGAAIAADGAGDVMTRIRTVGCVPAFICLRDGKVQVTSDGPDVAAFLETGPIRRVGTRDVSDALGRRQRGALTAGAALTIASRLGIRVVVTGGLGGVHHGFAASLDIASDLYRLAAAPVVLVSSGIRPFMDVPATAEVLKSLGVPVLGWRTDFVPRVYVTSAGPRVSSRIDHLREAARIAATHWSLGLGGLALFRPPEADIQIDDVLDESRAAAVAASVPAQELSYYLRDRLSAALAGRTDAHVRNSLIGNAELAAGLADRLARSPAGSEKTEEPDAD